MADNGATIKSKFKKKSEITTFAGSILTYQEKFYSNRRFLQEKLFDRSETRLAFLWLLDEKILPRRRQCGLWAVIAVSYNRNFYHYVAFTENVVPAVWAVTILAFLFIFVYLSFNIKLKELLVFVDVFKLLSFIYLILKRRICSGPKSLVFVDVLKLLSCIYLIMKRRKWIRPHRIFLHTLFSFCI